MREICIGSEIRCDQHGSWSSLPCAWPGCKNGLEENEFKGAYPRSDGKVYVRRKWNSLLGEYYSWDDLELANWFHVKQVFWNEARRHNLVPEKHPDKVYHYTSIDGLIGIVKSRSVWLTEFGYLNDRQELTYGFSLLGDTIEKIRKQNISPKVEELLNDWTGKIKNSSSHVYITSFSSHADSLSQWRAYGPIAIGVPVNNLILHVDDGRFQRVEYDPEVQEKLVFIYLNHLVNAYLADIEENRLGNAPDLYFRGNLFLEVATFLKNPAFKSESEYRLAYINDPEVLSAFNFSTPPKSFRVSEGKIVPYIPSTDISFSGRQDFPLEILEIVIGPENDELLEQGVRALLSEYGLDDVVVRRSLVPLRK